MCPSLPHCKQLSLLTQSILLPFLRPNSIEYPCKSYVAVLLRPSFVCSLCQQNLDAFWLQTHHTRASQPKPSETSPLRKINFANYRPSSTLPLTSSNANKLFKKEKKRKQKNMKRKAFFNKNLTKNNKQNSKKKKKKTKIKYFLRKSEKKKKSLQGVPPETAQIFFFEEMFQQIVQYLRSEQ